MLYLSALAWFSNMPRSLTIIFKVSVSSYCF
uniref:Uncharacterized protein n=1 Tax=Arundo donax TaxID=35708 RepID=A0A0A9G1P7_ARUDO